ncbi:MAG: hypothetical protein AB9834_09820 [Lentimicrobium sp.]
MKIEFNNFVKELKRYYSSKFIIAFLLLIILILSPILFLINKVEFDPAEFINIYVSTVFIAILLGVIIQLVELYKSSLYDCRKVYNILTSLLSVFHSLKSNISSNDSNLSSYIELISHYQSNLINSFLSDDLINQQLILLYKSVDIEYIKEGILLGITSEAQKKELIVHLESIINQINKTLEEL